MPGIETMRTLTKDEIEKSHLLMVDMLNKLADCQERKANFNRTIKEEIDYCKKMIENIRRQINSGVIAIDLQNKLPL
jgi:hypothetical protein